MTPAALLLAFSLLPQQPARSDASGVGRWPPPAPDAVPINGTLAIVNDRVLTLRLVQGLSFAFAEAEVRQGRTVTEADFTRIREGVFQDQLINLLFQEGYRQLGLEEDLVDSLVAGEIQSRIDQAGSIAAYASQLASEGQNLEQYTRYLKRLYTSILFRRVELGLMPTGRGKSPKATVYASPSEARRYYEEHLDEYRREFRVQARQITIRTEEDGRTAEERILSVREEIVTGQLSFADAAREHSEVRAAIGGSLGRVNPDQSPLQAPILDFLRQAEPGDVSDPLPVGNGWAIVTAEEVSPAGVAPFEEVQLEILMTLMQTDRVEIQREALNRLRRRCYVWGGPEVDRILDQAFLPEPAEPAPAEESEF